MGREQPRRAVDGCRCSTSGASTTACTTSCSSPTARWRWPAAATSATSTSWRSGRQLHRPRCVRRRRRCADAAAPVRPVLEQRARLSRSRLHRVPERTDAERRPASSRTDPAPGGRRCRRPGTPRTCIDQRDVAEELGRRPARPDWAEAEAFADSPDKVLGHSRARPASRASTEPTVRQGLMTELLLSRRDVLVSSPYLVPDRSSDGRHQGRAAVELADHGDHQFAGVDRRAAGARRLPALPHRDARPRRAPVRGGAEPGPAQQGPRLVRPVDRTLPCQGGGDRRRGDVHRLAQLRSALGEAQHRTRPADPQPGTRGAADAPGPPGHVAGGLPRAPRQGQEQPRMGAAQSRAAAPKRCSPASPTPGFSNGSGCS